MVLLPFQKDETRRQFSLTPLALRARLLIAVEVGVEPTRGG